MKLKKLQGDLQPKHLFHTSGYRGGVCVGGGVGVGGSQASTENRFLWSFKNTGLTWAAMA